MSAIRVPRTRRKNTVQQRDCHAPGQRPGSRLGPYLDQNVLGQLRRGNPDLNLVVHHQYPSAPEIKDLRTVHASANERISRLRSRS